MAWTKEQELAIHEKGTNIIVSAGAGSGKTAVLTTRVLEHLQNGIHIDELLILTFTNAAAGEMVTRIKKKIKEVGLLEELKRIDSAYITTFDSFALSIVKKYHYLLNIPKEIGITDESILSLQKTKILNEIFENYYELQDKNFENFIKDFCTKDDKGIIEEIKSLANTLELRTDKEEYLKSYLDNFYNEEKFLELITTYQKILKEKIEEIDNEINIQKNYFDRDYEEKCKEVIHPLRSEIDLDTLIAQITITKLPMLKRGSEEETKNAKEKINNILEEAKKIASYGSTIEIKKDYEETKDYLKIIIEILSIYYEKLDKWKKEHNAYDFTDIAMLSLKLLKENKSIKEELKNSLKEIMIDEYQDTSDTQEDFISLIENHNVYMVGDIKQSIYRFRNANPYIFKNKYDAYSKGKNGIKIDLLKNFRSRREVLDDINTIFNPIMTDNIGNAAYIETHQMVFGNKTYIEEGNTNQPYNMDILEYEKPENFSKEETEIFFIAKDIKEKIEQKYQVFDKDEKTLHDARFEDFCIIMDRNSTFDLTKKIFEYFKIPLAMYKDEVLNDSYDLFILKNLIVLLLSIKEKRYDQKFKYAYTSIARSYLYHLSDEEIFDTLQKKNYFESKIFQDLQELAKKINTLGTTEILEELLNCTNFYEKCITKGSILESTIRMEKIMSLSETLKNLDYDIYKFLDYLEELLKEKQIIKINIGENNGNAVKIMNIHKSKGLEFNICYFCGLYKGFSKEDLKGNIIYEKTLPIYMPNKKKGKKETFLKLLISDKMKKEDISEKIRLFYVALTRAKEKMILLLPKKENQVEVKDDSGVVLESIRYKYKSITDMLYSIPNTLKRYTKEGNVKDLELTKDYLEIKEVNTKMNEIVEKIQVEEIKMEKENQKKKENFSKKIKQEITKEEKKNLEFGTKFHNILEEINLKNFEENLVDDDFIAGKIKKMLQNDLLKNIEDAEIYQEYEFIYEQKEKEYHGIIDLMLVYETHIDIIDYKLSNITDEAYRNQLNGYKEYIESISNKTTHTYLFSILDEEFKKLS